MKKRPLILAHRGFKAATPENTMIAFEEARKAGADGIELDVQSTKDGHLVAIHDETIDRTTDGTGWIKDLTYAELCHRDAGGWFDKRYYGEKIPLLSDVLEWAKQHNMFVNIELKTSKIEYPDIEKKVLLLLRHLNLKETILISSFNHESVRKVKQLDPTIQVGLLYDMPLVEPWLYAIRMGACAVHPNFKNVSPELMDGCKKYGILVNPYTVNEISDMQRMIKLGVNSIITDYPDRLKQVLIDSMKKA